MEKKDALYVLRKYVSDLADKRNIVHSWGSSCLVNHMDIYRLILFVVLDLLNSTDKGIFSERLSLLEYDLFNSMVFYRDNGIVGLAEKYAVALDCIFKVKAKLKDYLV